MLNTQLKYILKSSPEEIRDAYYILKRAYVGKVGLKPDYFLNYVCEHFNIKYYAVVSKGRKTNLITARHVYIILARKYTEASQNEVGNLVNIDHSTVAYAEKQNHLYKKEIAQIEQNLNLTTWDLQ